jgi:hypothetical protein
MRLVGILMFMVAPQHQDLRFVDVSNSAVRATIDGTGNFNSTLVMVQQQRFMGACLGEF